MTYRHKIKRHLARRLIRTFFIVAFSFHGMAQQVHHIKITEANARLYRDTLTSKVFGTNVFPYDILPDSVYTNVDTLDLLTSFPYTPVLYPAGNLDSIDKFTFKLNNNVVDFPQKVTSYLFHPHNNNGKLFIYHAGHCFGIAPAEDLYDNNNGMAPGLIIPALIAEGYTVLAVPMLNYQLLSPPNLSCGHNNHDFLFADNHYQNPLSFFFTPLISSLNLLGRSNYSSIYMCGLSGGGWTTSIYPALDSSISISIPVAGSWPIPVKNFFNESGDYEQYYPPIFTYFIDYHEVYTLACLAPARKMLQINNRYDPCCFSGAYAHIFYADSIVNALQGSNGIFKFYLDETQAVHAVAKRSLDVMLAFTRNENAFLQNRPLDSVRTGLDYFYDIKNNFTLDVPTDNSILKFSLLKAPTWLSLDTITGQLSGVVPATDIISSPDSVSFKAEDSTGRFVIYNYQIIRKRDAPYIFTMFNDSTVAYVLLPFSGSIQQADPAGISSFYFNDPQLSLVSIGVQNNSLLRLQFNRQLVETDSIGYNGFTGLNPLMYNNGLRVDDFNLLPVNINVVKRRYAIAGMIRFNTETMKFEYFNGFSWVDMN